jgi:hypothetical protein
VHKWRNLSSNTAMLIFMTNSRPDWISNRFFVVLEFMQNQNFKELRRTQNPFFDLVVLRCAKPPWKFHILTLSDCQQTQLRFSNHQNSEGMLFDPYRIPDDGFCPRKLFQVTAEYIAWFSMRLLPLAEVSIPRF